jgi:drug/metabolite transporter (DMT)-like permease
MDNMRGAALMTVAMFGFAVEDMCIKLLSAHLPTWQIILLLAIGGSTVSAIVLVARREALWSKAFLAPAVLLRNLGEILGTLCFVTALALIPLASATAILQSAPLLVTLGAALFLGEQVGWRRWSAISAGFVGVLLIVRPGTDVFDPQALFALFGTLGLAVRDLATRRIPRATSSIQLSLLAFLSLIPAALLLSHWSDAPIVLPTAPVWGLAIATVLIGVVAYATITGAMRAGDISFVTGFRYSRLLFALVIAFAVFGERPDAMTILGASIVVGAGLYTLWRERKVHAMI